MAPQRSCVVCRGKGEKEELLRFVVENNEGQARLVLDLRQLRPGRGVYCHRQAACFGSQKTLELLRQAMLRGMRQQQGKSGGEDRGVKSTGARDFTFLKQTPQEIMVRAREELEDKTFDRKRANELRNLAELAQLLEGQAMPRKRPIRL